MVRMRVSTSAFKQGRAQLILAGLLFMAAASSTPAWAEGQLRFNLGLFYFGHASTDRDETTDREVTTSSDYTFYNFGGCYLFSGQICAGLKYMMGDITSKVDLAGASTSEGKTSWTGLGVSIGYAGDAWNFLATYFWDAEKTWNDGDDRAYGGTSYQVDVGYGFKGSAFMFGPMMSLVHFGYKTFEADGEKVDTSVEGSEEFWMPSLAIWRDF